MRRLAKRLVFPCAALAAAAAHGQLSDRDLEAREAIRGSFLSCAASGVLSEQATIGEALRRRLALPADASRDRIYDAICELTAPNSPRVRKASDEFVLEAGDLELRMRYDASAKHITWIESAGPVAQAPKPAPVPEAEKPKPVVEAVKPKPVVEAVKPKPVVEAVKPKPVVEAVKPKPVVEAVKPKPVVRVEKPSPAPPKPAPPPVAEAPKPAPAVIRLPPPVTRTGPCVIKPVMSDEDLRNCGADPDR